MRPPKEFSNAAEMIANYRDLRKRLANLPPPKPKPEPPPQLDRPIVRVPAEPWPVVVQFWPPRRTPLERIVLAASREFAVPMILIHSPKRSAEVVLARSVAFYLADRLLNLSTTRLGKLIGNRDHSTVIHAVRSVQRRMQNDVFAERIERLRRELLEDAT